MWIEKEISIGEVEQLMRDGYEVEVTSPDGFVPITEFVDKGVWDEYLLTTAEGIFVRCNENHLFETSDGWKYAKDMIGGAYWVYTDLGYSLSSVIRTGKHIPIVDVVVGHHNHRYYTNGVSSHNTNVGKSLFLCHIAAAAIKAGRNALYITAEMAEERIAERIECNLMDVDIDDLYRMSKKVYRSKIDSIESSTHGKLVIKEYATSTAHAGHFRALLDELKLKKNFVPDIILIDYINICASSRLKMSGHVNSYTLVKAIAEELRALAVDYNVPVLSATQTNRAGWQNSEVEMSDTSECISVDEHITLKDGTIKKIGDVELGDQIIANDLYKTVAVVHHKKMTECFKITLKSGKSIIVSAKHMFPSDNGRLSLSTGLRVGSKLHSHGKE